MLRTRRSHAHLYAERAEGTYELERAAAGLHGERVMPDNEILELVGHLARIRADRELPVEELARLIDGQRIEQGDVVA